MSYIQCVVTSVQVIFTSDGRVMDLNGNIVYEKYKKIIRVNENVAIGFAGVREFCEAIINESIHMFRNQEEIRVDSLHDKLFTLAKDRLGDITETKIQFIVGGRYVDESIGMMTLSTNNNYAVKDLRVYDSTQIHYACTTTDGTSPAYLDENLKIFINNINGEKIFSNIYEVMTDASNRVSIVDKSVNNKIFGEILDFN